MKALTEGKNSTDAGLCCSVYKQYRHLTTLFSLHGTCTYDKVGTTKHNWSVQCQYNVTGWGSMWACDMLSQ